MPAVWMFHVPLFFFLSGCTEALAQEEKFLPYVMKKARSLLLPWLVFSVLSLAVHFLRTSCGAEELEYYLKVIRHGNVRNTFLAGALWFLTCLFVMQVLFFWIRKLKNGWVILLLSGLLHCAAIILFRTTMPSQDYNLDSALFYLLYYAIGYVSFPYIDRVLNTDSTWKRALLFSGGLLTCGYFVQCFLGQDILEPLRFVPHMVPVKEFLSALLLICAAVVSARCLENIRFLGEIGRNTLYLCGGEYLAASLVQEGLGLIGLHAVIQNPFSGILYAGILLVTAQFCVVPVAKKILEAIWMLPGHLRSKK